MLKVHSDSDETEVVWDDFDICTRGGDLEEAIYEFAEDLLHQFVFLCMESDRSELTPGALRQRDGLRRLAGLPTGE